MRYRIIETDNYGRDYPNERFVQLPLLTEDQAKRIAAVINDCLCPDDHSPRFWRVVEDGYELQPGFEP